MERGFPAADIGSIKTHKNGLCTAKIHKPFYAVNDGIVYSTEFMNWKETGMVYDLSGVRFICFHLLV